MSALVTAFGQAARAAAKALENAGRLLEVAPYVEHRKWLVGLAYVRSIDRPVDGILHRGAGVLRCGVMD